jgi:glucosamine--fructose-6-phosphate aminotransferase (isomerizing)
MDQPPPFDPELMSRPDPDAILSGPPVPWTTLPAPTERSGPPWWMTDMIAAEPALAGRILRRVGFVLRSAGWGGGAPRPEPPSPTSSGGRLAAALRQTLHENLPVTVVGCGTSEHAAMAVAEILAEAAARSVIRGAGQPGSIVARQAFEAALRPQRGGLIIGVSHEGATSATSAALAAAIAAGARTAAITASRTSPIARHASIVVETGEMDRSWCHTVGYVSPIVASVAVGSALTGEGSEADLGRVRQLLADGIARADAAAGIARQLKGMDRLVVVASGSDIPAARELALKVEEGARLPATACDIETLLHGRLAAMDERTGVVLILADRDGRASRSMRAQQALAAAGRIGMRPAAILAAPLDDEWPIFLTPAGRILVDEVPALPPPVAALVGTATPLQLLAERLARVRKTNPDLIRRDQLPWREAAGLAE